MENANKYPNKKAYFADVNFGIKSEGKSLLKIQKLLGKNIRKSSNNYAILDFYSKEWKVKAEVKGRRNTKFAFDTTMIGENKIKEAQRLHKKGYEVFFFFDYTDKLSYFKISDLANIRSSLKYGGTTRRGIRERKMYRWVDVRDLTDIDNYEPIQYNKTKLRVVKRKKEEQKEQKEQKDV